MRTVTGWTHFAQYALQWGIAPQPEWFDHYLDQHWQWSATNNGLWVERGVFSCLVLKDKSRMLEICSGDGFNTKHFYSHKMPVDYRDLISTKPHFRTPDATTLRQTITYIKQDIREGLPAGPFDNIVWDAAIEHFTEKEIDAIMGRIVERLGADGILSGYTANRGCKRQEEQRTSRITEFKDKEDLRRFFTPHFKFVRVWETIYPTRHNALFCCVANPCRDVFLIGEG